MNFAPATGSPVPSTRTDPASRYATAGRAGRDFGAGAGSWPAAGTFAFSSAAPAKACQAP